MAEGLSRKKKICGGHRSSATRMINEIYETIESTVDRESAVTKLSQCKIMLTEKLETIKRYNNEILEMVGDDEVEDELDQADTFNEGVHRAIIDVVSAIELRRSIRDPIRHTVEPHATAATSTVVTRAPVEVFSLPSTTVPASIPSRHSCNIHYSR